MDTSKPVTFKMRLIVCLVLLIFAFVGLMITDYAKSRAWEYWLILVPIYALLSLSLSIYMRKSSNKEHPVKLWQEILHWSGLALAVYLIAILVETHMLGKFEAALSILVLLSLSTFLAGIYIDPALLVIGVLLGVFTAGTAFLSAYLFPIMIPLTILAVALLIFTVYTKKHNLEH